LRIRLLLFSVSFLVSLAVGELVLRFLPKFTPQPRAYVGLEADRQSRYLVPDPDLGWRMRPEHETIVETSEYRVLYRSNALGFRDERRAPPRPGDRRIALVGDSFAFGQGVAFEQSFGALIDARLPAAVVDNFALQAYGIDQMWLAERTLALPLEPVLLIVAFISDNFSRSLTAYRHDVGFNKPLFALDGGKLREQTADDRPAAWLWWLENQSRLWAGVRQMVRLVGHYHPIGGWWELNRAILDEIRADGRSSGVRVLFVYLPTRSPRPFPALADYMQATSADFLDLGETDAAVSRALTFPEDGHLNPDGHRSVAEAILAWIGREMPELLAPPAGEARNAGG
jgi:hypothetical protein